MVVSGILPSRSDSFPLLDDLSLLSRSLSVCGRCSYGSLLLLLFVVLPRSFSRCLSRSLSLASVRLDVDPVAEGSRRCKEEEVGGTYAILGLGGNEAGRGGRLEGGGGSREEDGVGGCSFVGENCRGLGAGDALQSSFGRPSDTKNNNAEKIKSKLTAFPAFSSS